MDIFKLHFTHAFAHLFCTRACRTHLEEAHSDNAALQERLFVLQQEVDKLDDEVANKRPVTSEPSQKPFTANRALATPSLTRLFFG